VIEKQPVLQEQMQHGERCHPQCYFQMMQQEVPVQRDEYMCAGLNMKVRVVIKLRIFISITGDTGRTDPATGSIDQVVIRGPARGSMQSMSVMKGKSSDWSCGMLLRCR
jgi:hypothetical protein